MKKFTCIAEYKGGTYISQYLAEDVFEAERIWANNLHPRYFKPREKKKIIEQINEGEFKPLLLKDAESVWCDTFVILDRFLLLNIVETVM